MDFFSSVTEHLNKTFPRTWGEMPDGRPGNGNDRSSADGCDAGTVAQVSGQSPVTKHLSFVLPEQLPDSVLPARAGSPPSSTVGNQNVSCQYSTHPWRGRHRLGGRRMLGAFSIT